MVVVFEFLGEEQIDNLITSMRFAVDKVIYFGYKEVIKKNKGSTISFLEKYCGVQETAFIEVSQSNLQSVLTKMREGINAEIAIGNSIYFDITGGESLILVAFGILSREYDAPMHMYDIEKNRLIVLTDNKEKSISENVKKRIVKTNIDMLIEMKGGVVNYDLHKDLKGIDSQSFSDDIKRIWSVANNNWGYWTSFSEFLRDYMNSGEKLEVRKTSRYVLGSLSERERKSKMTASTLNKLLDELEAVDIIENVLHSKDGYRFYYKNKRVKECLLDGGSILELHTYQNECVEAEDCRIGIHLDWDGVVHDQPGRDVINEVDVLSFKGNVLKFISCKCGKMNRSQILHALYELETVANRFGGKYAKKELVVANPVSDIYRERAKEMGIIIK